MPTVGSGGWKRPSKASKIRRAAQRHGLRDAVIRLDENGGLVVLGGIMRDQSEKDALIRAVKKLEGVGDIQDDIVVERPIDAASEPPPVVANARDGVMVGDTATVDIKKRIEDSDYRWRTLRGLARQTGLSPEQIRCIIESRPDVFLKSTRPSKSGEDLYTTREKYADEASFLRKFTDIITSSST